MSRREDPYYNIGEALVGEPGDPEFSISFDGSVQSSGTLTVGQLYLFQANAACHIKKGADPSATTSGFRLAANMPYPFTFSTAVKIAAIKESGGDAGILQITPMTRYSE